MTANKTATDRPDTSEVTAHVGPPPKRQFRMREITILMSVILATVVFGLLNHRFIGIEPATAILEGASTDGLMVIGMTIVIVMIVGEAIVIVRCFLPS